MTSSQQDDAHETPEPAPRSTTPADVADLFLGRLGSGRDPAPDGETASETAICSSRGCRREAIWAVLWNNPKLHPPERRKVWAACDEHREHLADFLRLRGFLRDVKPLSDAREQS